jgi:hypothetical protein
MSPNAFVNPAGVFGALALLDQLALAIHDRVPARAISQIQSHAPLRFGPFPRRFLAAMLLHGWFSFASLLNALRSLPLLK